MSVTWALIPARGGSKGIPRKNIVDLCGKPLIAHTIEKLRQCSGIERVFVSTDDQDIAQVALQFGAEVPFLRPAELAQDQSSTIDTVLHFAKQSELLGLCFDKMILVQATCPLTQIRTYERALELYDQLDVDVLFAVAETDHPPQLSISLDCEPKLQYIDESNPGGLRRQDFQKLYRPTGNLSVFKRNFLLACGSHLRPFVPSPHQRSGTLLISSQEGLDIDTPFDLKFAQFLIQNEYEK